MADKNIFQKVVNAFTNEDEKAAAQAAALEAAAKAETLARANLAAKEKAAADAKAAAEAKAAAAAKLLADQKAALAARLQKEQEMAEAKKAVEAAQAAFAALPRVKVGNDDTLSGIALKHYGHATEPYWRLIYNQNKAVIGDNPGMLKVGTELIIPKLPDNLKK